jgi:hypothetical protein
MLGVQGVGSAILVSYTRTFRADPKALVRSADRDALVLVTGAVMAVGVILVSAPALGRILLGSTDLVNRPAILGWGLVAVGIAGSIPFTNVTSIAGAPRSVVGIRMVDLILSLLGVSVLLQLTDSADSYVWTPTVLGVVVCVTALVQRSRSRRQITKVVLTGESPSSQAVTDAVASPGTRPEVPPDADEG